MEQKEWGYSRGSWWGTSSPRTWHLKDSPENTFKGNRELAKASESQKKPGSQKCLIGNIRIPFPAEWLTPSGPVHNSETHQSWQHWPEFGWRGPWPLVPQGPPFPNTPLAAHSLQPMGQLSPLQALLPFAYFQKGKKKMFSNLWMWTPLLESMLLSSHSDALLKILSHFWLFQPKTSVSLKLLP